MKQIERIFKNTNLLLITLCIIIVAVVGVIDTITGAEVDISVLYLIPVVIASWWIDRQAGIFISVLAAVAWFLADHVTRFGYSHPAIPYWNAGVTLLFSLVVTYGFSALKKALIMQDQLSQFIVHDLRSPLTNVLTGLQTLKILGVEEQSSDVKEIVEMGVISSNRMLGLIGSLLDVPKMESGRMPVQQDRVRASELVDDALKQVKSWASQNNVSLISEITPQDMELIADRDLTVRVITNLISNALKFSPSGAEIVVSASQYDGGLIRFSVKDQGQGISEEWAKKVFDKYAQVEARKHGAPVGTGLGLTFCRLAVEAQGGHIWLESILGHGTTFIFSLPVDGKNRNNILH